PPPRPGPRPPRTAVVACASDCYVGRRPRSFAPYRRRRRPVVRSRAHILIGLVKLVRTGPATEQPAVQRRERPRPYRQPDRHRQETGVAQDLLRVMRLPRGHLPTPAEAAAVDGQSARPGLRQ